MAMMRSRLMSLLLTIFVGLGLASAALAHRAPTSAELGAEQAAQMLQAAGLPLGTICGQTEGKPSCPDASCPICPGGAAMPGAAMATPVPELVAFTYIRAMPRGTTLPTVRLLLGHDAQGPPANLI